MTNPGNYKKTLLACYLGIADMTGGTLKTGLLAAVVFPAVLVCGLLILRKHADRFVSGRA